MREGWEYKKFENCIVKSPKLKQVKKEAYNNGSQYPIISQEEKFISGYCDDESMVCHIDRPVVVFGDHTRVLKYIDFDFVVGADGVKVIIPIKSIDSKFLLYFLQWYNIPNLGYSRHYKLLKDVMVPIPNCTTQLSIVSELDKLNELIQIKKEQLKDYDALAQSIFYEMFGDPVEEGWDVKELGDICKTSSGGTPSKAHTEYYNGEIMWLRSGEVSQGDIYNTEQTITLLGLENSSAKIFPVNTVVIAMYGATVGQVGILRKEMSTNQAICGIFPNGDLTPEYLYYFWIRKKAEFLKSAIGGAQANISQQIIRKTLIPLPPLSLQSSFTCKIRQIKLQKAAVQSTITDLETLLAARMQYWFD